MDPIPISQMAVVRDHSRTFPQNFYVYPVISRRSEGLSIGVNLNPDKVCNFDCIYCEVNRRVAPLTKVLDVPRMREELVRMIQWVKSGGLAQTDKFREARDLAGKIKDIAFSGDGEPTMVPNFAECVRTVAEVKRAEGLTKTKLVLITDAAGLDKVDVKQGLAIMDANQGEIWGKLDAGTEAYFRLVNRTHIVFDRILKNLAQTAIARPIVIQSLFLRVHGQGMPPEELAAYCGRLRDIAGQGGRIREVHAYTVARPTPEAFATAMPAEDLEAMAVVIRRETGLVVRAFP